ncbi:MAG: tetratricopeptide repeat protein [Rubrivivax sp.]
MSADTATFLFTDIEGSTRLWEREPEAMRLALARHDAVSRQAVQAHRGLLVKSTGDGIHAVFDDAADAVHAVLALQQAFAQPAAADGLALRVRAGLHSGPCERRDGDFYGPTLNRAARIMNAAHGGQALLSSTVVQQLAGRLPEQAALRDLGSVRLRDLAQPERVHQLLHPALRAQFPPLRSLEATPNNLAQQLNSYVGREQQGRELRELLARSRLLTLLGMGGIGKSRLSVQVGAELLDEYPDGVWLVELAPLADPLLVPQALASVLGVKEDAGRSVLDALLAHVRDKTLLVILDNCEHLVHACADLAKRLLQAGAGVKLLASSRDALQVAGETIYQVPTLDVPAAGAAGDLQALGQHEAVRLFVDRASAVQPGFRLEAGNAAAVAEICRRLDGIPLALELAAARTRALSAQAIAARLNDRFRLLVSGDQTVLPRQRTLRALIDWSHELLSEPERMLFQRLAVFAGGWTLEAAEAVGGGDGLDPLEVLDLLAQLVQKSLVLMEPSAEPQGEPDGARYRMLDTVRAYAAEKLAAAGDAAATRERHLLHYLALAEQTPAKLTGPEQGRWLQQLDHERENLLLAHEACGGDARHHEQGLQLVFALKGYWRMRGLLALGQRVTVEALQRLPNGDRGFSRCRALCDAGQLSYFAGDYVEARRYLEESHAIAAELQDRARIAAVLQPLGMVHVALGDHDRAEAIFREAVALARAIGNRRSLLAAANSLAQLHRAAGRLQAAEPIYREVIALARELGDQDSIAIGLLNLSMALITRGQPGEAGELLREVHAIAAGIGSRPVEQSLLEVTAGWCAADGDWEHAARFFGSAESGAARTGIRRDAADESFLQPLIGQARNQLGAAAFAQAEQAGREAAPEAVRAALAALFNPDS